MEQTSPRRRASVVAAPPPVRAPDLVVALDAAAAATGASGVVFAVTAGDQGPLFLAATSGHDVDVVEHWRILPVDAPLPLAEAWRTGQPVFCGSRTEAERRYPALTAAPVTGNEALAVVPLPGRRGAPYGVVGYSFAAAQDFREGQQADLVARSRVLQLDLEASVRPVDEDDEENQQLMAALEATTALTALSHTAGPDAVASALCAATAALLGCDHAVLWSVGDEGADVVAAQSTSGGTVPGELLTLDGLRTVRAHLEVGGHHFADIGGHGGARHDEEERLRELGLSAWMQVPVWLPTQVQGHLLLWWRRPQPLPSPTALFSAAALGRAGSAALSTAAARDDLSVVQSGLDALKTSIRPPRLLLQPAGLRIAHWWDQVDELGGDFVDVIALPDGTTAIVIGDVCGHGPDVAAVSALIRGVIHGAALALLPPARVLEVANEALQADAPGHCCTAVVARVRRRARSYHVHLARAGHPFPLLRDREGRLTEVRPDGAVLGLLPTLRFEDELLVLDAGDLLVLYTDGITETRGRTGFFGTDALEAAITMATTPTPEGVVTSIRAALEHHGRTSSRDDRALLVLQCQPLDA